MDNYNIKGRSRLIKETCKKFRLLILNLIILTLAFTACSKSENTSINTPMNTPVSTSINTPVPTVKETPANTSDENKDFINYENKDLGFSFNMPKNWEGKYTIKEDKNSIYVYYKPVKPVEYKNAGLLFAILKKGPDVIEDRYDRVGEPRTFTAKGAAFITGGPTDIGFPDNHEGFAEYTSLKKDVSKVVGSIKVID
jgi:hypothetical protein